VFKDQGSVHQVYRFDFNLLDLGSAPLLDSNQNPGTQVNGSLSNGNDTGAIIALQVGGTYTVRVEAPGFAKVEAKDQIVNIGQLRELPIALSIASAHPLRGRKGALPPPRPFSAPDRLCRAKCSPFEAITPGNRILRSGIDRLDCLCRAETLARS
jgi:hypothetical protein